MASVSTISQMFNETNPLPLPPILMLLVVKPRPVFDFFFVPCFRSIDLEGGGFKVFAFDIVKVSLVV